MKRIKYFVIIILLILNYPGYGQDDEDVDRLFTINTPLTVDLSFEEEEIPLGVKRKKKKRKKKTYYGIKTKKGFTKSGFGEGVMLELFYFLKEPLAVDQSIRDIYWYDYKRKMIRKGAKFNPEEGALLHGPYRKIQNGVVLDSGVFYVGRKHGTWLYHDRNDILVDKEKYYLGWPRESLVRYYDRERTKMKEIIPVEFGEREGFYYYFYDDGKVAVRGEYRWGSRVGDWTEYYTSGGRKKIIRYPRDPFSRQIPVILREWSKRGRLVYDYSRIK